MLETGISPETSRSEGVKVSCEKRSRQCRKVNAWVILAFEIDFHIARFFCCPRCLKISVASFNSIFETKC